MQSSVEEILTAYAAKFSTVHVTDWKAQKEDPVLYTIVKHLKLPQEEFKDSLKWILDKKAIRAYLRFREGLMMKDGHLYHKTHLKQNSEEIFCFVVPKTHRDVALDGCHCKATHQSQCHSFSLMQEYFWWPGMAKDIEQRVKNCTHCKKYEGSPPIITSRSCLAVVQVRYCTLTTSPLKRQLASMKSQTSVTFL